MTNIKVATTCTYYKVDTYITTDDFAFQGLDNSGEVYDVKVKEEQSAREGQTCSIVDVFATKPTLQTVALTI